MILPAKPPGGGAVIVDHPHEVDETLHPISSRATPTNKKLTRPMVSKAPKRVQAMGLVQIVRFGNVQAGSFIPCLVCPSRRTHSCHIIHHAQQISTPSNGTLADFHTT